MPRDLKQLLSELEHSKEERDAFVEAEIAENIPFQIRFMRKLRGWTQQELAERSGQNQPTISDLENPNKSVPTVRTLLKVANAFDVGLIVAFVPFRELVNWAADAPVNIARSHQSIPPFAPEPATPTAAATESTTGTVIPFRRRSSTGGDEALGPAGSLTPNGFGAEINTGRDGTPAGANASMPQAEVLYASGRR